MRKLLIGFFVLGSIVTYANEYNCYSEKGLITISNNNKVLAVDFKAHEVINAGYFETSFIGNQRLNITYDMHNGVASIQKQNLTDKGNPRLQETRRSFMLKTFGGADFSSVKLKLTFNKKRKTLKLKFTEHAWFFLNNKIQDILKCEQQQR